MEVQQEATSQEVLQKWAQDYDYLAVRTEPPDLLELDYRKTEIMPPMCVTLLVDLSTMKVLNSNCGAVGDETAAECINEYL